MKVNVTKILKHNWKEKKTQLEPQPAELKYEVLDWTCGLIKLLLALAASWNIYISCFGGPKSFFVFSEHSGEF